jgi:hypothetical protein
MNLQPSFGKIVTIDYAAFSAFLFPPVMWGVYLFFLILQSGKTTNFIFLVTNLVVTIISIPVLFWRIHLINTIFDDGIQTRATISDIYFYRDRGRIEYIYTYLGQEYTSGNSVHRAKPTRAIKIGDQVTVMVDRNKPKRAYIRDLYL